MSHTPTVVHDFADPLPRTRWPAFSAEMVSLGLRSCFTTPIVSPHPDEKVLGTFAIYHREPGDPSPHDQQLVDFVTRTVALVIERSQAEERLRERDEQLRRIAAVLSDADRRKNEFLAMLADELRNPLAPIRNALQVMRLTGGNGEAVRSMTEMLERQVGQMVRLVDDLLDGSRISRGTIELRKGRIELASAVNHAVEANRPLCASMNHELTVTLPAPPVYLNADPTRLAQVVGSLLNNACRFTDTSAAAGRLLISGRALPTSSWHGRPTSRTSPRIFPEFLDQSPWRASCTTRKPLKGV